MRGEDCATFESLSPSAGKLKQLSEDRPVESFGKAFFAPQLVYKATMKEAKIESRPSAVIQRILDKVSGKKRSFGDALKAVRQTLFVCVLLLCVVSVFYWSFGFRLLSKKILKHKNTCVFLKCPPPHLFSTCLLLCQSHALTSCLCASPLCLTHAPSFISSHPSPLMCCWGGVDRVCVCNEGWPATIPPPPHTLRRPRGGMWATEGGGSCSGSISEPDEALQLHRNKDAAITDAKCSHSTAAFRGTSAAA